jgi:hypothetical protein
MLFFCIKGDDLLNDFEDHDEEQGDQHPTLSLALLAGSPAMAVPVPKARVCEVPNTGTYTIQSHILIE